MNVGCGMKRVYLNVGCGRHFYTGEPWINLDMAPSDSAVISWDARTCLPMETNSCDVVYHSHVLEHFSETDGARLIEECHRVLKPCGILRVVVPDLENICREYLSLLDDSRSGEFRSADRLAWIKVEMMDQCVRHESGGLMKTFFLDHGSAEKDYIVARLGTVGLELTNMSPAAEKKTGTSYGWRLPQFRHWSWKAVRSTLLHGLLNREEAEAMRVGQLRTRGEVHLCMYDSVTLERLFKGAGFEPIAFYGANTSQIEDWARYHLDVDPDGREHHAPSSLRAEGRKRAS